MSDAELIQVVTEKERIARAAIRTGDLIWSVPRPQRHGDIMRRFKSARLAAPEDQGFLTSANRFVSRAEARTIAEAAGQLLPNTLPHTDLFSEDLW